jgi:DNA-binding response OmpR family regulator
MKRQKKLFKENNYAAVLLDIDLPRNESLKLLREIKKNDKETCVIILFTHIDDYIQEQCKFLGADFFLTNTTTLEKYRGFWQSIIYKHKEKNIELQHERVFENIDA